MHITPDQVTEKVFIFVLTYIIVLDQGFGSTVATVSGLIAAFFGKTLLFSAVRLWISFTH